MKVWKRVLLAGTALGSLLVLCGCDNVVLENPLDSMVDDRIVGSWAKPDGTLYSVIRKGDGGSYVSLDPDDLKNNKPGSVFYLAKAGTTLFAESQADCTQFWFKAPLAKDSPKGCWTVNRVVLGDNFLEYDTFSATQLESRSKGGEIPEIGMEFGIHVEKGANKGDVDTDALILGLPNEMGTFLGSYSMGQVYSDVTQLHRI